MRFERLDDDEDDGDSLVGGGGGPSAPSTPTRGMFHSSSSGSLGALGSSAGLARSPGRAFFSPEPVFVGDDGVGQQQQQQQQQEQPQQPQRAGQGQGQGQDARGEYVYDQRGQFTNETMGSNDPAGSEDDIFTEWTSGFLAQEPLLNDTTAYAASGVSAADQDLFFSRVYGFYAGKGFSSIALAMFLQQLELLWVVVLVSIIWHCTSFVADGDPVFATCESPSAWFWLPLIVLGGLYSNELLRRLKSLQDYRGIKRFYEHVLHIDQDLVMTMDWSEVVARLCRVPGFTSSGGRTVSELDICNRIMRRENIMIAMMNEDVLNLRVPGLRAIGLAFGNSELGKRQLMTKTVEWGLQRALFNYAFRRGKLHPAFRDRAQHGVVANQLRSRLRWLGLATLIFSPFVFVYLVVHSLFQYGEELRNRPSMVTARRWSALARWKFRQLNELPHAFRRRLNAAIPPAERYIATCFPGNKLASVGRFVSFVCGSVIIVLLLGALIDDDFLGRNLLNSNDEEGKSGAWLLGVCTALLAIARGVIPDDNSNKEFVTAATAMEEIVQHTHYFPRQWRGRTHTLQVKNEFTSLFAYSSTVFATELSSVLLAPLVFMFSLPQSADAIVDFLRANVVTKGELGDIVDAASFPMSRRQRKRGLGASVDVARASQDAGDSGLLFDQGDAAVETGQEEDTNEFFDKLEASFLAFKATYPTWEAGHDADDFIGEIGDAFERRGGGAAAGATDLFGSGAGSGTMGRRGSDSNDDGSAFPLARSVLDFEEPLQETLVASQLSLADTHRQFFRRADRMN